MPWGWIMFSTATSPDVAPYGRNPLELEQFVRAVVEKADPNAKLHKLFFEVGAQRAYALVKDLDDYEKAKAVTQVLGATRYVKLLDPEQAENARQLENELRGGTPSAG